MNLSRKIIIGTALLLSWLVSVMVAPLFGTYLIQAEVVTDASGRPDPYQSRFYQWFRRVLAVFLTHRRIVLAATAVLFLVSTAFLAVLARPFPGQYLLAGLCLGASLGYHPTMVLYVLPVALYAIVREGR